jgi:hypothetical protein
METFSVDFESDPAFLHLSAAGRGKERPSLRLKFTML